MGPGNLPCHRWTWTWSSFESSWALLSFFWLMQPLLPPVPEGPLQWQRLSTPELFWALFLSSSACICAANDASCAVSAAAAASSFARDFPPRFPPGPSLFIIPPHSTAANMVRTRTAPKSTTTRDVLFIPVAVHGPHPAYCHRVSTKFEYFFLTRRDAVAVIFN